MKGNSTNNTYSMTAVILANGKFPEHSIPLKLLKEANTIVCCDGAVDKLEKFGLTPNAIVGDLDSIPSDLKAKYSDRLFHFPDQNSNDLTKAVNWCKNKNIKYITILGATGMREDHAMGNIGLLCSYAKMGVEVEMVTDYGVFQPVLQSKRFISFKGQAVSIFSSRNETRVTSRNLEFPLNELQIPDLWMGTLNKSIGIWFELDFAPGPLIVYQSHKQTLETE
jgi:thiamine pyrophosphokinase